MRTAYATLAWTEKTLHRNTMYSMTERLPATYATFSSPRKLVRTQEAGLEDILRGMRIATGALV